MGQDWMNLLLAITCRSVSFPYIFINWPQHKRKMGQLYENKRKE
jgi:hypothetical protein